MSNYILYTMEIVRKYDSMGNALRQKLGILKSEALLDFAYGAYEIEDGVKTYKAIYLDKDFRRLLGECLEIHDQGYDFADRNTYELDNSFEPPNTQNMPWKKWETIERDGLWLSLDVNVPEWLKEVHNKRKEHRKLMAKRKELGLNPNDEYAG